MKFKQLIGRLPKEIINNLIATNQNPKYHKEGNVYIHTQMVFDEVVKNHPNDYDLMVATIFHDLGKIDKTYLKTRKDGTKSLSSDGHEYVTHYLDKYLHLYSDIISDDKKIYEVVINHMRAHLYINHKMKRPHKRKVFESNMYFEDIINFAICDHNGRIQ